MSSVTYDELVGTNPTDSFFFKAGMLLNRVQRRVRFRLVVEMARLFFLGFYEDFVRFAEALDEAESRSRDAAEFEKVWSCRLNAAEKIERLVECFDSMRHFRYKGKNLVDYVIGDERLEQLRAFVQGTRVDEQAELAISRAKNGFLSTFAARRLNRTQRSALLEKYREMANP
jgi:hypothetical protein